MEKLFYKLNPHSKNYSLQIEKLSEIIQDGRFPDDSDLMFCNEYSPLTIQELQPILNALMGGKGPTNLSIYLPHLGMINTGCFLALGQFLESGKCPSGLALKFGTSIGHINNISILSPLIIAMTKGKYPINFKLGLDNQWYTTDSNFGDFFDKLREALNNPDSPPGTSIDLQFSEIVEYGSYRRSLFPLKNIQFLLQNIRTKNLALNICGLGSEQETLCLLMDLIDNRHNYIPANLTLKVELNQGCHEYSLIALGRLLNTSGLNLNGLELQIRIEDERNIYPIKGWPGKEKGVYVDIYLKIKEQASINILADLLQSPDVANGMKIKLWSTERKTLDLNPITAALKNKDVELTLQFDLRNFTSTSLINFCDALRKGEFSDKLIIITEHNSFLFEADIDADIKYFLETFKCRTYRKSLRANLTKIPIDYYDHLGNILQSKMCPDKLILSLKDCNENHIAKISNALQSGDCPSQLELNFLYGFNSEFEPTEVQTIVTAYHSPGCPKELRITGMNKIALVLYKQLEIEWKNKWEVAFLKTEKLTLEPLLDEIKAVRQKVDRLHKTFPDFTITRLSDELDQSEHLIHRIIEFKKINDSYQTDFNRTLEQLEVTPSNKDNEKTIRSSLKTICFAWHNDIIARAEGYPISVQKELFQHFATALFQLGSRYLNPDDQQKLEFGTGKEKAIITKNIVKQFILFELSDQYSRYNEVILNSSNFVMARLLSALENKPFSVENLLSASEINKHPLYQTAIKLVDTLKLQFFSEKAKNQAKPATLRAYSLHRSKLRYFKKLGLLDPAATNPGDTKDNPGQSLIPCDTIILKTPDSQLLTHSDLSNPQAVTKESSPVISECSSRNIPSTPQTQTPLRNRKIALGLFILGIALICVSVVALGLTLGASSVLSVLGISTGLGIAIGAMTGTVGALSLAGAGTALITGSNVSANPVLPDTTFENPVSSALVYSATALRSPSAPSPVGVRGASCDTISVTTGVSSTPLAGGDPAPSPQANLSCLHI